MDFKELSTHRYSARSYLDREVPEEILETVLEAARAAPTAANRQPFQLIVITTEGRQEELLEIYNRDWFVQPPLVICITAAPEDAWVRHKYDQKNYAWVDAAIAFDHLTLQAAELGLGTCWIAAFNPRAARSFLQLPDGVEPVAFTPLGYPADRPLPKKRKPLKELVRYETW